MSASPILIILIMLSSAMCLSSNSWVSIWFLLEVNTLSFCVYMKSFVPSLKKNATTNSISYFIIQSVASSILIFSALYSKMELGKNSTCLAIMAMSLMIKMAAVPFHTWFINIVKKSNWKANVIVMTWQKLAPTFLVIYQMKILVLPFILMSSFVGCLSQMNKVTLKEIMAFSSVFNISWSILSILCNMKLFILFMTVYWMSVLMSMSLIFLAKSKSMSTQPTEKIEKWILFTVMINLAGVPPLAGFVSKWLVLLESITMKVVILTSILLVISSMNLYIYMRMINSNIMKSMEKNQIVSKKSTKSMTSIVILISMATFPIVFI
uniref:NADH dehydrogenase subunit 2 n=1 Tax=Ceratozetella imperatoria TaxID=3127034 RepID=UPI00315DF6BE